MKKVIIAAVCVVLAIFLVTFDPPKYQPSRGKESNTAEGVYTFGDAKYYAIIIPGGSGAVGEYFSLVGQPGTVVVEETDVLSYSNYVGTVYYSAVRQGGWVAYQKEGTACVLYIPASASQNDVMHISSRLAGGVSHYMTLEEAGEYIYWLK